MALSLDFAPRAKLSDYQYFIRLWRLFVNVTLFLYGCEMWHWCRVNVGQTCVHEYLVLLLFIMSPLHNVAINFC